MKVIGLLLIASVTISFAQPPVVRLGIEVLRDHHFDILQHKHVGLITNPTGVDSRLTSTIDILNTAPGVTLIALFGPEHGVRGNFMAGDKVESTRDSATGIMTYSLYGGTRKPTPEMLKGIDVLLYDIQDIGCRSYTYISTMGLAMEAAAENNIEFVVCDRPNPLGGIKMEGNIVEKGFESFVSQYPIPYVYGLTCGELARMLNDEGMLKGGKKCKLTVIPMKGWNRSMTFPETGLPWVPTSPHIPDATTPQHYVSTGMIGELGVISEGVGYTLPFSLYAAPWINAGVFADKMNSMNIAGVFFRPITFRAYYGRYKDSTLNGVQIHITDFPSLNLMSLQFLCTQVHNELYPAKNPFTLADPSHLAMFDKVAGSDQVRKLFTKRMEYSDISEYLRKDSETFRKKASRYFLY